MSDSLSVFTRGWWGGVSVPPTPIPSTGGASSGRGQYVDWSLPRKRWIDREDEELLFIIMDD